MTKAQMQELIKSIIAAKTKSGFAIFTCLKADTGIMLKQLQATDKLIDNTERKLLNVHEQKYLSEEMEYDSSDNIADNKKALYAVIQDEKYHPFDFLKDYRGVSE